MDVGIVNMYGSTYGCHYLVNAINALKQNAHVIDGFNNKEEDVYLYIKNSQIKYWIFSGSPHPVLYKESTQVPLKVLTLKNKKFMMLCYSMESILLQLHYPLKKRNIDRKEPFRLTIPVSYTSDPLFMGIKNPSIMRRHHMWYIPNNVITEPVNLLGQYNGEAMVATYKNSTLIQFHPEKSPDGKKLIMNWLSMD
jgi:anthranilate/para-aminobenzoate synthase component II